MVSRKAVLGAIEEEELDEIEQIGVYNINYLRNMVDTLWGFCQLSTSEVELAHFRGENGLNVLLARPADSVGGGWLALAPIDPSIDDEEESEQVGGDGNE